MKKQFAKRLLAALLAVVMAAGLPPAAFAQDRGGSSSDGSVTWKEVDNKSVTAPLERREVISPESNSPYADDEQIRVSIVLEDEPAIAMFAAEGIAEDEDAAAYREFLEAYQESVAEYISEDALDGEELDVVWNLTLAANMISANVEYSQIEAIKALDCIEKVIIEPRIYKQAAQESGEPQMIVSTGSGMTNTAAAWTEGYKGQGMRIAIIDDGLDIEHQSFNNDAFLHALKEDAGSDDLSGYNLLDAAEIAGVYDQLNVSKRDGKSGDLYYNEKIPFTYNYVDRTFDATHMNDAQGAHGSHVAGIAAANRYLKRGDTFADAMDEVYMTGNAPDAQVLVMKVFGQDTSGATYYSDLIAALEDALLLGCDAVNMSLGSSVAGFTDISYWEPAYQAIYDRLAATDMVVSIASCNYGNWAQNTPYGYLYSDDVNFQTGGEPGTFPNGLTVASVDNNGAVGLVPLDLNGVKAAYSDATSGNNLPLASLEGTFDYVYINGYGSIDEYDGIDAAGKVVLVSRGGGYDVDSGGNVIGNFTTKAYNAITQKGAAALLVYNNVAGGATGIGLGFDDLYTGTAPVAGISLAAAEQIKAASTRVSDKIYTGRITISSGYTVTPGTDGALTMSDFSSWGVPGDLSLKPEITAPGGDIWSLYGASGLGTGGHDQYQSLGGTSMATPQITGISTLLKQSIQERDLLSRTGIGIRALTQSLLMSTATPLKDADGNCYPVIQQGAGLVNTSAAVSADSCILMDTDATDSYADGKIKVELGDDPAKTGVYSFTFTISNLDNTMRSYILDADVFTQATFEDYGYTFLSTSTEPLRGAQLTWSVLDVAQPSYDFDGNGTVNLADGAALLDYVTGNRSWDTLYNRGNAYFGRDTVDSYSAHQFLQVLDLDQDQDTVTVPAGGSATVRATITLSRSEMNAILQDRPNGAYVEAYVYVTPLGAGTSHSIPVLGFYGSWTAPSMFDRNTYPDWTYGQDAPDYKWPYMYYYNGENGFSNYLTVRYASGGSSYVGSNPFSNLLEDEYVEARNAMNNANGDKLDSWTYALIRNYAAGRVRITDARDGTEYFNESIGEYYYAAYSGYGPDWYYTSETARLNWAGTDANQNPLPEDTELVLTLEAAPELYVGADGSINWDALGGGARLATKLTIDNTAPQLIRSACAYDPETGSLTVTARDNQFVSAVYLATGDGGTWLDQATPNQMERGEDAVVTLHVGRATGQIFLVQVYDYACNARTYEVTVGTSPDTPELEISYRGYNYYDDAWGVYSKNGTWTKTADGNEAWFTAGTYCNGKIYAFDDSNDFYVMDADNLSDQTKIASPGSDPVDNYGNYLYYVLDMAYDSANDTMYFTCVSQYYYENQGEDDSWSSGWYTGDVGIGTIDLDTGDITNFYWPYSPYYALAVDDEGTLYGVAWWADYGAYLYTISIDEYGYCTETEVGDNYGWIRAISNYTWYPDNSGYYNFSSMTWDSETEQLVLAANGYWDGNEWRYKLYTIDPSAATAADLGIETNNLVALYTQYVEAEPVEPTDEVESVSLPESLTMLIGSTQQLTATVLPENLADQSVTWTSDAPGVVKVTPSGAVTEDGWERPVATLTAAGVGTATITAASTVDPSQSARCVVTVQAVNKDLTALVYSGNGDVVPAAFNTQDLPDYRELSGALGIDFVCATESLDNYIYAATNDGYTSVLYKIDPDDYTCTEIGTINGPIVDLADAPYFYPSQNTPDEENMNFLMGVGEYGGYYYLYMIDKRTGQYGENYVWRDMESAPVGLAYLGYMYGEGDGWAGWNHYYALIDANGDVWYEDVYTGSGYGRWFYDLEDYGKTGRSTNGYTMYNTASYGTDNDGNDFLFWSHYDGTSTEIIAIDFWGSGSASVQGSFERGIGPVILVTESEDKDWNAVSYGLAANLNSLQMGPPAGRGSVDGVETMGRSALSNSAGSAVNNTNSTAVVTLTTDQASTNGKLEIAYDPAQLVLVSATSGATLNSFNTSESGKVVFAYAYKDAVPAGTAVAELVFSSRASYCRTTVSVTTQEDGLTHPDRVDSVPITLGSPGTNTPVPPSTGSGGSGGSGSSAQPAEEPSVTGPVSTGNVAEEGTVVTETTAVIESTTEGGTASATVSPEIAGEIVDQAVSNGSDTVVIAPEMGSSVTEAEVTLPAGLVSDIAEKTDAELRIETPVADVTIPNEGLSGLAAAGGEISVSAERDGSTVAVTISANGQQVDEVTGGITVSIPQDGCTPGTVAMLVHEDGTTEVIRLSVASSDGRFITVPLDGSATIVIMDNSAPLSDVPSTSWAADAVAFVTSHELMSGTGEGVFDPDVYMTRAMLAKVLHNLENNVAASGGMRFSDVPDGEWYTEAVAWAAAKAIITGYPDGSFGPDDPITREQLAVMLYRYVGSPAVSETALNFTDADQISDYARQAIAWAVANGIMNGKGNGTLDPQGTATRAEVAQLLLNFVSWMA